MKKLPKTKAEFAKYLSVWFDRVQAWIEHLAGIDEQEFDDCAALLNEASTIGRRLGAGHLAATRRKVIAHEDLLDVLGRMLAWCKEGDGEDFTTTRLAQKLKVSPDKVRNWISSGELRATNVAKAGRSRPKYRIWRRSNAAARQCRRNQRRLPGVRKLASPT
jgi:hypothetical protein